MSYFTEDRPYREYLLTVTDQKEVRGVRLYYYHLLNLLSSR